jgi:hypothetical protein
MEGDIERPRLRRRFNWRRWNTVLHRDVGYIITGLTLVYGISGIAINHVHHWNPNYQFTREVLTIEPIRSTTREGIIEEALQKLNLTDSLSSAFRPDPETIQLFFPNTSYTIDQPTGNVLREVTHPRRVLFEMNQLHLNTPKRIWTYIADLYALSLIFVAVTGLFVLKGRLGITGRGAWLTLIGAAIPIAYWIYYLSSG